MLFGTNAELSSEKDGLILKSLSPLRMVRLTKTDQNCSNKYKKICQIEYQPVQPLPWSPEIQIIHHISPSAPVVQIGQGSSCKEGKTDLLHGMALSSEEPQEHGGRAQCHNSSALYERRHMTGKPSSGHAVIVEPLYPDPAAGQLPPFIKFRMSLYLMLHRQINLEQAKGQLYEQ